ncbi:hypothetical protein [Janthinobacterium sp. PSPC2-1]|uniref:hypothetical protein n=1 Tax=unclassified Janthinobacterium TaxID=2610881 RepID=UPI003CE9F196
MIFLQSGLGLLVGVIVAGLLGGCTTTDKYAAYKNEVQQDYVVAGKFQLMTADPRMSGQNYYARLTNSNGIWTSEVSAKQFRRTNELQELFVIDAEKMQIKPDFVTARGDHVIVPDKYQTVICPPDFISSEWKKVKYTVCTTAFSASLGSVKWTEMASVVAGSDLSEKVLSMAAVRAKDAAQAEADKKAMAARVEKDARLRAIQDKEKYQLLKRDSDARADIQFEASNRARALQCGPVDFADSYIRENKKYMADQYDHHSGLKAIFTSAKEMEQQIVRETTSAVLNDVRACTEDVRSMIALQKSRTQKMLDFKQADQMFKRNQKISK